MLGYPDSEARRVGLALDLHTHPAWAGIDPHPGYGAIAAGERIAAAALLLCLLPVLAAAALIVMLLSRRSPLVAHERVGQAGRSIWVLKLRTMWGSGLPPRRGFWIEPLDPAPVPATKKVADPRVTSAFAAFCRRLSIDELPQLWHVVRGEMSLVGPRPLTAEELVEHYGRDAGEVLRARPGLTGLWQIKGRSALKYAQRRRFDLFLVRKWSPWLYLRILLATIPKVLTGKDAC